MRVVVPKSIIALPLLAALSGMLNSCGTIAHMGTVKASQDVPEVLPSDQELEVGTVAMVVRSRTQPFVLIRTHGPQELPEKALLLAQSQDGSTATLRLSAEKQGHYLVADLIAGQAALGDTISLPYPGSRLAQLLQPMETADATASMVSMEETEASATYRPALPEWASSFNDPLSDPQTERSQEPPSDLPEWVTAYDEDPLPSLDTMHNDLPSGEARPRPRFGESHVRATSGTSSSDAGDPEAERLPLPAWTEPESNVPFIRRLENE